MLTPQPPGGSTNPLARSLELAGKVSMKLFNANDITKGHYRILLTPLVFLLLCFNLGGESIRVAANLELYATFHAMGIIVTIAATDDPDMDASAAVEYRTESKPYQAGFPLTRISDTRFVGSLFWLEPATTYDVRVTFSDPDGGSLEGVNVTATGATRAEVALPALIQSSYYVALDGNGTNCTLPDPCSLNEGVSRAGPGDEVVLRGGVYYQGELSLPRSGAPNEPIIIRSYPGEDAILDGADPTAFAWANQGNGVYQTTINVPDPHLVVAAGERLYPYDSLSDLQALSWNLPGFYVTDTTLSVRLADNVDPNTVPMAISRYDYGFYVDDDFITFLNLTFRHYGRVSYAKAIFFDNASENLVQGCTFALNNQGINIKYGSHRNVIQDNEFYDSIFDWSWDAIKEGAQFVEAGGVYVNEPATGRGNVIRRNTFHDMFDGFHVCPAETSGVTNETDVYQNLVYRVGDDGMETDGRCSNVRIWANTFHDVLVGISLSPVYAGPVYAIRNVIYNSGAGNNTHDGSPFKFIYSTSSDGPVYLFHNTSDAVNPGNDGIRIGGEPGLWDLILSRNNIWAGTRYALANYSAGQVLNFDYDDLYTLASDRFAKWEGLPNPSLASLADLQAQTGQELNGRSVDPGFVNPANGDYHLGPSSQLVDAGLVIPGINSQENYAYQGSAPDIGAYEVSYHNAYLPIIVCSRGG